MTKTLLVVIAHPDDCELSCGGAVARWVQEGWQATLAVATNGARGGKFEGSDPVEVARQRHAEQQAAAEVLGFSTVVHLDFEDGELTNDPALRGALVELARRYRPQRVIAIDPLTVIYRNFYVNHSDHRALGVALLDALYPQASNAGYFPEQLERGLKPHKVPELWLATTNEPNAWVDVSDTLHLRWKALHRHKSQMRLWPDNGESIVQQQTIIAAEAGLEHGVRYAELYRRVVVDPLS